MAGEHRANYHLLIDDEHTVAIEPTSSLCSQGIVLVDANSMILFLLEEGDRLTYGCQHCPTWRLFKVLLTREGDKRS